MSPTATPSMTSTPGPSVPGARYFQIPIAAFRLPVGIPFDSFSGIWTYSADGSTAYVMAFDLGVGATTFLTRYQELPWGDLGAVPGIVR